MLNSISRVIVPTNSGFA